jgi:hypothetical protein
MPKKKNRKIKCFGYRLRRINRRHRQKNQDNISTVVTFRDIEESGLYV